MAPPPSQQCSVPDCHYTTPETIHNWDIITHPEKHEAEAIQSYTNENDLTLRKGMLSTNVEFPIKCFHVERNKQKANKLKLNCGNYQIMINVDIIGINGKISLSCDKCKGKT